MRTAPRQIRALPIAITQTFVPCEADPAHMHDLRDVTADSLVYSTNRRNDVDMDVVVRDLATGEERVVYDGGGYVAETVVSHDGTIRDVTATPPSGMTIIDLSAYGVK